MDRAPFLILLLALVMAGCVSSRPFAHENQDLIGVQENPENGYLLLVYRDTEGTICHVVRRTGVVEWVVTYRPDGKILLKRRSERERRINEEAANRLMDETYRLLQPPSKVPALWSEI